MSEEPELDQERHRVPDVAVADVERRQPDARGERGREQSTVSGAIQSTASETSMPYSDIRTSSTNERSQVERRAPRPPRRAAAAAESRPWKQLRVARRGCPRRPSATARRESTARAPAKTKTGYGTPLGRDVRELPEEDGEDAISRSGWSTAHSAPKSRLLVADLDVAPDQEVQELSVRPELAQMERIEPARRLDDDERALLDRCWGCPRKATVRTR